MINATMRVKASVKSQLIFHAIDRFSILLSARKKTRFDIEFKLQIHLKKTFLLPLLFLDLSNKPFLDQILLNLRNEKWGFLRYLISVILPLWQTCMIKGVFNTSLTKLNLIKGIFVKIRKLSLYAFV